jgi:hypothetical protein
MKRAVSISIGSSKRDKAVEIDLMGERVRLERIGTDGDIEKAAQLYRELDGVVDAFGVGGTDLGMRVGERFYKLHSIQAMVRYVRKTPLVDGNGLKASLERRLTRVLRDQLSDYVKEKTALVTTAVDRWGMAEAALEAGYSCVFGDLIYSLGIPIPLRTAQQVKIVVGMLMPIATRLPFEWVYPVGESQGQRKPKYTKYFSEASVVMGDCHYIYRYMPDDMRGKVVITNTTTPEDTETFRRAGVRCLVTTTPVLDGRSFGTNMMEAALVAASGRTEAVDYAHPGDYYQWMASLVEKLHMEPQLHELNPQEQAR